MELGSVGCQQSHCWSFKLSRYRRVEARLRGMSLAVKSNRLFPVHKAIVAVPLQGLLHSRQEQRTASTARGVSVPRQGLLHSRQATTAGTGQRLSFTTPGSSALQAGKMAAQQPGKARSDPQARGGTRKQVDSLVLSTYNPQALGVQLEPST